MGITVKNRNFDGLFSTGDSFLKMNENSFVTYTCDIEFDFVYQATSNDSCQLSAVNQLTLLSSNWGEKGFVIGDTIVIQGVIEDTATSNQVLLIATVVIQDINGGLLTFSPDLEDTDLTPNMDINNILNTTFTSITGVILQVINTSRSVPESLEFYANLVENTSQGSEFSLIDGEVNRFRFLDVDTLVIGAVLAGEQLGDKSGGAFGPNVTLERTSANIYKLTVTFYNWIRYEQAQFNVIPSPYQQNNSLKPYIRFEALAEVNNPNAILLRTDSFQLGNCGFIGENYNQGINNMSLVSYINEDDDGNPISGFDFGQPNNIEIKVQTSNGNIDDKSILLFQHLPISDYQNNERSFNENTLSCYSIADDASTVNSISFDRDGAELGVTSQSISVSGNEITHTIRVVPNSDYTQYFEDQAAGDRFYRITIQTQSASSDDAAVVLVSEGQAEIQPPIGEEAEEVTGVDFYNHGMEIDVNTPIAGSVYAMTEDDILCHSVMNFNKADNYDAFRVLFQVVNNSNNQFFNLFSRTVNLTQYQNTPAGVKLINYNENLGFQLPNPDRNVLSLQFNGTETSTTYEVEFLHTLLLSWRYWQAKPQALADFLDVSLPNNGLTDEWVRYAVSGFSFRFRLELVKDGIADFFNAPQFFIANYDSEAVTTIIEFEDMDGNPIPAPLNNQQFKVIATHTAPTAWDANDLWGWIAQRPLENEPRRMNSTAWAYISANLPLLPEQGETESTLVVNGNDAIITTLCEGSQLPSNVTFVSRIQSPVEPSCTSPLSYLFDFMNTLGGTEQSNFELMVNILRTGEWGSDGLCCPECEAHDSRTAMAFGSFDVIDNDLPEWWTDDFCCHDIYDGDGGCTEGFNAQIDAIYAAIDGDLTAFDSPNQPTQVNPYFSSNWELLGQLIIDYTADEELRYDMVSYFILNGLLIYCISGTTIFQTIRAI